MLGMLRGTLRITTRSSLLVREGLWGSQGIVSLA